MNVKFGLVLDKPNQFLNKGSNTLFLGDFEYCNAGDRSARIYVSDSNGDIVEVEDDIQSELITLREKILKVTENLPSETWKPKLIYLVKSNSLGDQKFSKEVIENIYKYYMNNLDNLKPYHVHTSNVGVTHKLIPYIDERVIFGIIEGDKIEDLVNIFNNLANKYLDTSNHLFTTLYNTIMKYNLNFSQAYQEIANVMDQFDKLLVNTINVYLYLENLNDIINKVNSELGCPDKIYSTSKFVNGTAERFSTINFSSKNINKDQIDEPFVDIIIVALKGDSIVKYCSFRLDKRTQSISNFYGDSTHFYFENMNSYPKLPINVKNGFTYKIITNWDLNLIDTLGSKLIPDSYLNGFTGITNDVKLEDLILLSNGKQCKLELTIDEKGGRILSTIDRSNNAELSSVRSELTSPPSSNYLRLIDGDTTAFFELTTEKKREGLQPTFYDKAKNITFYLKHTDKFPVYTQMRISVNVWNMKGNGGTSLMVFYDYSGKEIHRISGNPIFPSIVTNKILNIPEMSEIKEVLFRRYIDTRSFGGAHLNVEMLSAKTGWKKVVTNFWYRTGPQWEDVKVPFNIKPEP